LAEQRIAVFDIASAIPVEGWVVSSGHPMVQQRFFAAIDICGCLCWTDDPGRAEQFPLREDAERFANLLCPDEDWTIVR
jgi:hypothetical protein